MALLIRTNGDVARDPARLFDRFFDMNSFFDPLTRPAGASVQNRQGWMPEIDVVEKDGAFHIECALPGMKKDDIVIEASEDRLTISAKVEARQENDGTRYHFKEVRRGSFARQIGFTQPIDVDRIEASYENGILAITVPVVQTIQAKKVEIKG